MTGIEELDTGYYDLVAIVSHKGRTADGGHYVGWVLEEKKNGKDVKDDVWLQFDDEDVSRHLWKEIMGIAIDLQGGRADTQIAYINIYKKVSVTRRPGQALGTKEQSEGAAAPAASSGGEGKPDAGADTAAPSA